MVKQDQARLETPEITYDVRTNRLIYPRISASLARHSTDGRAQAARSGIFPGAYAGHPMGEHAAARGWGVALTGLLVRREDPADDAGAARGAPSLVDWARRAGGGLRARGGRGSRQVAQDDVGTLAGYAVLVERG
jgi:hypothetical protein